MMSINDYLIAVYNEFKKYISEMDMLCSIRSLNYMGGKKPDYSDKIIQLYYLLRYAYAYTFEYSEMYSFALNYLRDVDHGLSVLSVGCGALTDYAGLRKELGDSKQYVNYTGIDRVDWMYKAESYGDDHLDVKTDVKAADYFNGLTELNEDIYMFPKSISELSDEDINSITEAFRTRYNYKDEFCICASVRKTEKYMEEDLRKLDRICKGALDGGYRYLFSPHKFVKYFGEGICVHDKDYRYPKEVMEGLKNIGDRCKHWCSCGDAGRCAESLVRRPILKTGDICFRVAGFKRRNAA